MKSKTDILEGKWNQLRGKVKEQWGEITDDDVSKIEGKRDEIVGLLQERYGKAKDAAEREVDAWIEKNAS